MTRDRDWLLLGYGILIVAILGFLAATAGVYYW